MYRKLRDILAAQITGGAWGPGDTIASETDLIANGFSNTTVRKALRLLEEEGLIERRQGAGSFVRRPTFASGVVKSVRHFASAGDRRNPESRIVQRCVRAGPPDVLAELELPPGASVIRLDRIRIWQGNPVLLEEIWIPEAGFEAILTMAEDRPQLLYPLYESLCGKTVACATETIALDTVTERDQELLGMAAGSAVVLVKRIAHGFDGRPIETCRSRGPATTSGT